MPPNENGFAEKLEIESSQDDIKTASPEPRKDGLVSFNGNISFLDCSFEVDQFIFLLAEISQNVF